MKKFGIVVLVFTFIFLSVYIFTLYFVDSMVLMKNQTEDEVVVYACDSDCKPPIKLLAGGNVEIKRLNGMSSLHINEKKIKLTGGRKYIIKIMNGDGANLFAIEKTGY